jgi:hypothetical protein
MSYRILIIGLGDLGQRLATGISKFTDIGELLLASRRVSFGIAFAERLNAYSQIKVRFLELDAEVPADIKKLLHNEHPDLIVQCGSLLSPWYFDKHQNTVREILNKAGFAAQISAQLPLITAVMLAVKELDCIAPVVNCSYPDLTHPVLAQLDLAPTIGIGNVSMIQYRIQSVLRQDRNQSSKEIQSYSPLVRVLAHHSHVKAAMQSIRPCGNTSYPKVFIGEIGQQFNDLAYTGAPLVVDSNLNALSAESGLPILQALLPNRLPLRISAPGPLGLPGGYPIQIVDRRIELDLPQTIDLRTAILDQWQSARLDGIANVDNNGTISFTESTQALLQQIDPALSKPLTPFSARDRFNLLRSYL